MIELAAIAATGSLDNLGVTVGMGVRGAWSRRGRIRQAVVFGLFEAGMPLIGLLLGQSIAGPIGAYTSPVAGLLLVALGVHGLLGKDEEPRYGLFLPALFVSIDNLAVGLALGIHHTSLAIIPMFAVSSVAMAYIGLTFGAVIGAKSNHAGMIGSLALILVGVLIGSGVMG